MGARTFAVAVAIAVPLTASACSGDDSGPPPVVTAPTPSAFTLAPQVYVLPPAAMSGYTRTQDATVSAPDLAGQDKAPDLVARLAAQGYRTGARATYGPPQTQGVTQAPPFNQVISEALLFTTATGAAQFFADESVRRGVPPEGGTIQPLTGLPQASIDQLAAFDAHVPATTADETAVRAFFVLVRRGSVVAELLGSGSAATVTVEGFTPYLVRQEQLLATSPGG